MLAIEALCCGGWCGLLGEVAVQEGLNGPLSSRTGSRVFRAMVEGRGLAKPSPGDKSRTRGETGESRNEGAECLFAVSVGN